MQALDSLDQSAYILGTAAASARTLMIHDHFLQGDRSSGAAMALGTSEAVAVTLQTRCTTSGQKQESH